MDIVCQKLDQQTEDLRQRILNEEKVKECLKYFQKRISKIYDTAHFNAEKIDSRRMKLLILHNAIKFIKYECEKLQQNPALFSSEFGSIIYNEIMEFSERTIAHLQSNVHDCGCNNSDTLSIAPPPSIMSISLYEDSDEVNHSSNKNMVAMENDRDIDDDDSYRNKQLDQISPFITEKDLQNLNDVVVVKKDDDYEKALPHNDQQFMDMVFIPPSLQNEFEEKFSKINMKKTKELSAKVKMDDNVVSTEDLLKFFYMEKYGKAKKREKDEKMYEDEHFKSWYENKAKGKAHEFVNDKLKLKYDLYTFYKNKYGKSKLLKDERTQMVYFSRSFQSWYEKKLSKKHSSVKKWLNHQKDKVYSVTSSSSNSGSDDDNTSANKVGGSVAVVSPPISCINMLSPLQKPLNSETNTPPQCTIDELVKFINNTPLDDDAFDKIKEALEEERITTNKVTIEYTNIDLISLSEEDINEIAINDVYSSVNFFVPYNIKETKISNETSKKRGGASSSTVDTYNKIRLYSDIKHDFKHDFKHDIKHDFNESLPLAKTEEAFIGYALKDKIPDIYKKTYYANMKNIKGDGFVKTPILSVYEYAVMDMRMGEGITVSPQQQQNGNNTSGGINEIITYGNLMDATMRQTDTPNMDWYGTLTYDSYIKQNLIGIINTFFQGEFLDFSVLNLTYEPSTKSFTMTMNDGIELTFNGKDFERKNVEEHDQIKQITKYMSEKGVLTNDPQKILFKRMFKSLGDHIQLHELVNMKKMTDPNEKINDTIFATSDQILVADAIRNDMDVMFSLSDTFFKALKDNTGNNVDMIGFNKIPPFSDEDKRERKETYFIIYTNKTLRSDMKSFSKMFHSKLKLYINVMKKLEFYVGIDDNTSFINGLYNSIQDFNTYYPEINDANDDTQVKELIGRIINLVKMMYSNIQLDGAIFTYTNEADNVIVAHDNLYHVLNYLDIVFAIIESGIYSFETMQMSNKNIASKTREIIRLISQYTTEGAREPSSRSKDYRSLEDLYDELNKIFYWAFIDISNDGPTIVTNLLSTLSTKYSSIFSDADDGVSPFINQKILISIETLIRTIFSEIFKPESYTVKSEEIDQESKAQFDVIHSTLMRANYLMGNPYNIFPLSPESQLPVRKRLLIKRNRIANFDNFTKILSVTRKRSERTNEENKSKKLE
jgi:hypothetical protein